MHGAISSCYTQLTDHAGLYALMHILHVLIDTRSVMLMNL